MRLKIFDISPTISEKTPVFPGDAAFKRKLSLSYDNGHHLELSSVETTVHIGAHADAPSHYHPDGMSIEKRELTRYVGSCQVIDLRTHLQAGRIYPKDLEGLELKATRVLLRTDSFNHEGPEFKKDFNSLSPELVEYLAEKQVELVGIDTPSVDPSDSKELESHQALYRTDMAVLEGLDLRQIEAGLYFLSAAPLKLEGAEAAPTRAILISEIQAD